MTVQIVHGQKAPASSRPRSQEHLDAEMARRQFEQRQANQRRRIWYCLGCRKEHNLPAILRAPACPGCGRALLLSKRTRNRPPGVRQVPLLRRGNLDSTTEAS